MCCGGGEAVVSGGLRIDRAKYETLEPEIELREWIQIDLNIHPPQTRELLHSPGRRESYLFFEASWLSCWEV